VTASDSTDTEIQYLFERYASNFSCDCWLR